MCLLKEVSVIVARRMLFKRNTFRCQFPQCKKKGNEHRTMSATKFTSGGAQTKTFGELLCAPSSGGELHQRFTFFFSAVHILLSMRAFFMNSLILVALHKESSLHPPSLFADKTQAEKKFHNKGSNRQTLVYNFSRTITERFSAKRGEQIQNVLKNCFDT